MNIAYIRGDATCPQASGTKIICHVCNDLGKWGKGFVLAISKRWSEPEAAYREWYATGKSGGFALGAVQFVAVESHLIVANMIGQRGVKRGSSGPPIRYDAIDRALGTVGAKARELGASVHMPRIGCGLAGGEWSKIEPLIAKYLGDVHVLVYDFAR